MPVSYFSISFETDSHPSSLTRVFSVAPLEQEDGTCRAFIWSPRQNRELEGWGDTTQPSWKLVAGHRRPGRTQSPLAQRTARDIHRMDCGDHVQGLGQTSCPVACSRETCPLFPLHPPMLFPPQSTLITPFPAFYPSAEHPTEILAAQQLSQIPNKTCKIHSFPCHLLQSPGWLSSRTHLRGSSCGPPPRFQEF